MAFHHVVLFRLRPGVTLDQVRAARESLSGLIETLPGVLHFVVTDNLAKRNGGFTMALFSSFENRQAFEIFNRHPEFQRVWGELLDPVVEESMVAEGEEN
ncbi:MAG: Dabb family protein [Planctomycetota bacterium]